MSSGIFERIGVKRARVLANGAAYSLLALAGALAGCSATPNETGESSPALAEGNVGAEEQAVAAVPALPSPLAFARGLDLECYHSEGQPPVAELGIRQLNPVLKGVLPNQKIQVKELMETCLPVSKNQLTPPPEVLRFIRWVDLACYRAEADPVDVPVNLRHLNPVLQDLPNENVRLKQLRRFCSPVRKNFSEIEAPVRRLIEHMDFACYEFDAPTPPANRNLVLSHLNPVVRNFGFNDRLVQMDRANQLCVPVAKNLQPVPDDVQHVVEWVDFATYQTVPLGVQPPAFPLVLSQLNPLFAGAAITHTVLTNPRRLMVPVAKNQVLPPNE